MLYVIGQLITRREISFKTKKHICNSYIERESCHDVLQNLSGSLVAYDIDVNLFLGAYIHSISYKASIKLSKVLKFRDKSPGKYVYNKPDA